MSRKNRNVVLLVLCVVLVFSAMACSLGGGEDGDADTPTLKENMDAAEENLTELGEAIANSPLGGD